MPDKNIKVNMLVQITGNLHDDPAVERLLALPLLERTGVVSEEAEPDEEWGPCWWVNTNVGRLGLCEQDLSPLPDLSLRPSNNRGFLRSEFADLYGSTCSVQESSLATEGAIWLGVNDDGHFEMKTSPEEWALRYPNMTRSTGGRMHLSRGMAAALIPLLLHFVETGSLPRNERPS